PPFGQGRGQGRENRSPTGRPLWAGCAVVGSASPTPWISPATTEKLWKSPSLCVQALTDGLHLVPQSLVFLQLVGDLFDGVQSRRVVAAAERLSNRRQRRWSFFPDQKHRDLSRKDDVLVAPFALHIVERHVVVVGNQHLDAVDVDRFARAGRDDVGEQAGRL